MTHPARGVHHGRKPGDPLLDDRPRYDMPARPAVLPLPSGPQPPPLALQLLAAWIAARRRGENRAADVLLAQLEGLATRPPPAKVFRPQDATLVGAKEIEEVDGED